MTPEQFLLFADPLPEPTLLLLSDGRILAANRAVEERLGMCVSWLRTKRLAEIVAESPDEVAHYLRLCCRSRSLVLGGMTLHGKGGDGIACRMEGTVVRPQVEGAAAILMLRLLPKESVTGQFIALNQRADGLAREVQRRQQAEERIRQQEERLRITLLCIGDAVISTDEKARVTFLNPVAEQLVGWTSNEAINQPLTDVFHIVNETTRQPVENPALRSLQEGKIVGLANHTILISKDGTERPIDDSAAPIINEHGDITGSVLVFRDISEHRRLEEHLRQAQKMEAIGRLAGGIAHDFNNIMTIISGYSEMLLADDRLVEAHDFLQHIHDAGRHAASLTQQIMAFSRKQMLVPSILNLNTIVRDMSVMVKRMIGENIEFITEMAPNLGQVKVDPTQIGQVILNLAANARDAMPKDSGGRLVIATANAELDETAIRNNPDVKPGRYAMLSVSDTGCGISEDVLDHIFEPFFTTKGVGQGTGLGLATVYGIVKQSEGHIEVSSNLGAGTTIKVYLPLIEDPASITSGEQTRQASTELETILLVEDEEAVRTMIKKILQQYGYTVLEASNGLQGLAVAENHRGPIHLLMADLVMPDLSGREIAERLMPLRPGLRVLFMSGYSEDMIAHQGMEAVSTNFLSKPFSLAALAKKVREVLKQE